MWLVVESKHVPKSEKMACGRGRKCGICDQGGGDASVWLTHGGLDRHVEVCSRTFWWNMNKVHDS